jgi:hypothetical protein
MARFWLIQRGTFKEETGKVLTGKNLIGPNGIVTLHYMGSSEFQFAAIEKAYRRLMYHFSEYEVFHAGIYTPENDELLVFCKKSCSTEVIRSICQYIEKPYHLKEYSELEEVHKAKKGDTSYDRRHSNFWWCIDIKSYGDWMAFLQSHSEQLLRIVKESYQNWWLVKSPEEREEEYQKSLRW